MRWWSEGSGGAGSARTYWTLEVHVVLDALMWTCLFAGVVALLSVPFMPRCEKRGEE